MDEHSLAIMRRLDLLESGIKQIASFLRTKSSTLGEKFPELLRQEAEESNRDNKPGGHFEHGIWRED